MMRPKEALALRAGVAMGMAAGFCFAAALAVLVHVLRSHDRIWATHWPLVYLFGIVPLIWFVWGVRVLRTVEAAD